MPKAQRKPEEIETVKQEILDHAVELIFDQGYKGFSMRKLASRLNVSAKTIYNYFHNKDEIYLVILTRGFERLYSVCETASARHHNPFDKIRAMCRAFVEFGLENANLYNLMFTWHVPKFNDYVGTGMEPTAQVELETALAVAQLFLDMIRACTQKPSLLSEEDARFIMIQFWTQAHGYIAGINNTLLDYMHQDPLTLKEPLLQVLLANFEKSIQAADRKNIVTIAKIRENTGKGEMCHENASDS